VPLFIRLPRGFILGNPYSAGRILIRQHRVIPLSTGPISLCDRLRAKDTLDSVYPSRPAQRLSDALIEPQAGKRATVLNVKGPEHDFLAREYDVSIELRMVSNLRMHATSATFFGLPAPNKRS
jgi:hypothetical protein